MEKRVESIHQAPAQHWVGDGFPVRSLFSYGDHGRALSPFLLLDYAGPMDFAPASAPRGVGVHPHRGFETVTIVYQGEVAHRDSTGAGGVIGPGDVQWMTAASGILHEEFHSPAFTASGGTLEMVQLWVNLPARDKLARPGYQSLQSQDIPVAQLPGGAGTLRAIAGSYGAAHGPARTATPMQVWDMRLHAGARATLDATPGHNTALVLLRGSVRVAGAALDQPGQLAILERAGEQVGIEADSDATLLWLSGAPIDEPVVGYGPFVMNTQGEIQQALADMRSGQFGRWRARAQ
jgi:redox-sensitive bicupin YhaK (pirin superfamily)